MGRTRAFSSRGAWSVLCSLAVVAGPTVAVAAPVGGGDGEESRRLPFTSRYEAVQHGGIARAANSAVTCVKTAVRSAPGCSGVRAGGEGRNGDYDMTYVDVDRDRNTYNSSRARLSLPSGSEVSYARLYWGGNLRVGEQKPAKDNRRVLLAEEGGRYKEVRADSVAHRTTGASDAYSASADVTKLVRRSGSGAYTVGQINVARGHSRAGAWGGWTLVVAYENAREPLRRLALWDGRTRSATVDGSRSLRVDGFRVPRGARGSVGLLAYNGDRGAGTDSVSVRGAATRAPGVRLHDAANPATDVMNSTISDHGRTGAAGREPGHGNTLGLDSDVMDLTPALTEGAGKSGLDFRFRTGGGEGYELAALFLQARVSGR
ncbi:hypothetical protein DVA86_20125 [Streptomyces armeniacus]|uniref:DUF3344 domain-containing protein n=1 Tax=Streptomyces armeniacus TaxID=83291 RepID=A0A345XSJ5_9ACTN|nr:hypothetical protein [Streptomyces armeniacus]AXK34611.1 hypothetical protein DVA86_20125 [Streptomyces armeniacus]